MRGFFGLAISLPDDCFTCSQPASRFSWLMGWSKLAVCLYPGGYTEALILCGWQLLKIESMKDLSRAFYVIDKKSRVTSLLRV
jgi:hypothetical protein